MDGKFCIAVTAGGLPCRSRSLSESVYCEYHISMDLRGPGRRRGKRSGGRSGGGRPIRALPAARGAVEVYTDGACRQSHEAGEGWAWGPGGWAWVEVGGGRRGAGGSGWTTNQRMELAGALDAVLSYEGPLIVVSDSQYLVRCFADGWWRRWVREGWMRGEDLSEPVKNRDLWEPLVGRVEEFGTVFRWVKGHRGNRWNEEADRLAGLAVPRAAAGRVADFRLDM